MVSVINKSWSESSASWSSIGTAINSSPQDSFSYKKGYVGWMDFDVTDAVKKSVSGTIQNNGFMVTAYTETPEVNYGISARIHSSESDESSLRPKLTVICDVSATKNVQNIQGNRVCFKVTKSGEFVFIAPSDGKYTFSLIDTGGRLLKEMADIPCSSGINTVPGIDFSMRNKVIFIRVAGGNYLRTGKMIFSQ